MNILDENVMRDQSNVMNFQSVLLYFRQTTYVTYPLLKWLLTIFLLTEK